MSLRSLMSAVAVVALLIAGAPSSIYLAVMLGGPLGVLALIRHSQRRWGVTWSRAALWVGAAYPWVTLGVILVGNLWIRYSLHRGRSDPVAANVVRLVGAGVPVVLLAVLALVVSEVVVTLDDGGGPSRRAEAARLVLVPLSSWVVAGGLAVVVLLGLSTL